MGGNDTVLEVESNRFKGFADKIAKYGKGYVRLYRALTPTNNAE